MTGMREPEKCFLSARAHERIRLATETECVCLQKQHSIVGEPREKASAYKRRKKVRKALRGASMRRRTVDVREYREHGTRVQVIRNRVCFKSFVWPCVIEAFCVIRRRGLAKEELVGLDKNSLDESLRIRTFSLRQFLSSTTVLIYREGDGVAIDGQESLFHCERCSFVPLSRLFRHGQRENCLMNELADSNRRP